MFLKEKSHPSIPTGIVKGSSNFLQTIGRPLDLAMLGGVT